MSTASAGSTRVLLDYPLTTGIAPRRYKVTSMKNIPPAVSVAVQSVPLTAVSALPRQRAPSDLDFVPLEKERYDLCDSPVRTTKVIFASAPR